MKDVSHNASCAICVVEVKGAKALVRSCISNVAEGMEIKTHSPLVDQARKINLELILANHPKDCLICERNGNCELRLITATIGIKRLYLQEQTAGKVDDTSVSLSGLRKVYIMWRDAFCLFSGADCTCNRFYRRGLKTKYSPIWTTVSAICLHKLCQWPLCALRLHYRKR